MSDWLIIQPVYFVFLPILLVPWVSFKLHWYAITFPGVSLVKNEPKKPASATLFAKAFASLGLLFIILGLAQPVRILSSAPVQLEGIAIEFVVDISGSMAEEIIKNDLLSISRLELAKKSMNIFLKGTSSQEGRSGDLVGLIAFASQPKLLVPLTLDHFAFTQVLDKLMPEKIPGTSETNITDALTLAVDRLLNLPDQKKIIILLTDGEQNFPNPVSGLNALELAQLCAKLSIPIYTLNAGDPLSIVATEEKKKRQLAQEGLASIAQITMGKSFNANDENSMRNAFFEIGALEKRLRESFYSKPYQDFYPWFLLSGLLFFSTGIFLPASPWQRIS